MHEKDTTVVIGAQTLLAERPMRAAVYATIIVAQPEACMPLDEER